MRAMVFPHRDDRLICVDAYAKAARAAAPDRMLGSRTQASRANQA
jgi:hypothetical protein